MNDKLRVGLILDSQTVPHWIYKTIEKIIRSGTADIRLVMLNSDKPHEKVPSGSLMYRIHEMLDRYAVGHRIFYHRTSSLARLLKEVPETHIQNDFTISRREIAVSKLDLILNLSSFAVPGTAVPLARYGVWHYSIENEEGSVCGFYRETMEKAPVLAAVVRCSNGAFDGEAVIHRNWFKVNYNSIHVNRNHAFHLCALILPRLLGGLSAGGQDFFDRERSRFRQSAQSFVEPALPGNTLAFRNLVAFLSFYLYRFVVYRTESRWFIKYQYNGKEKLLVPPSDRFWADPFVVRHQDRVLLFVEEFIYKRGKAHITLLELNRQGTLLGSRVVLDKPYHLSYPFVFEHDGCWYMIPETAGNRTIELYKCTGFPDEWTFVMNLMEQIKATDTTVFFHEQKWWLFTSVNAAPGFEDHNELYLFYSDNLLTNQWTPHPANPLNTDVRTARPAGRIFMRDGEIIRPSQDCSVRYGRAFNLSRITRLTENSYAEELLSTTRVDAKSGFKGTHTFNTDKNIIVTDVYKYNRRLSMSGI
ncbi:MAG: hypothetical protein AAGU19_12980 [Prolixibacteraceae bacterium]